MKVESHSGKDDWRESCKEYKTTKTMKTQGFMCRILKKKMSITYPPTLILEMQLAIYNLIITLSIVFSLRPLSIQKYYTHIGK